MARAKVIDRPLSYFLAKGGKLRDIGRCWAEKIGSENVRSMEVRASQVKSQYSRARVEYDPRDKTKVTRFYVPPRKVEEKVFFESEEYNESEG